MRSTSPSPRKACPTEMRPSNMPPTRACNHIPESVSGETKRKREREKGGSEETSTDKMQQTPSSTTFPPIPNYQSTYLFILDPYVTWFMFIWERNQNNFLVLCFTVPFPWHIIPKCVFSVEYSYVSTQGAFPLSHSQNK